MPLEDICVHTGTPVRYGEVSAEWVEGEPDIEPQRGTPFACVLFLPRGAEATTDAFRRRQVTRPTLLYTGMDVGGGEVQLTGDDELELTAAEEPPVARAMIEGRWMVDGDPQPFGPPGQVIGWQATLERVVE